MGEGDTLDGDEFLGVDRLVNVDGLGAEGFDVGEILDGDGVEESGGEAMFERILGRAFLAFGSGRSGIGGN